MKLLNKKEKRGEPARLIPGCSNQRCPLALSLLIEKKKGYVRQTVQRASTEIRESKLKGYTHTNVRRMKLGVET